MGEVSVERADEILKQILCGGSIKDKLSGRTLQFEELEWSKNSNVGLVIEKPGRVGVLKPREIHEQSQFPTPAELKNESARGKLLHFFANHELLAIETMAYALLKFPDAPESFRRGLFRTLQDEQRHMTQYMERMQTFGVNLGDLPLNLYFWNTLKSIQTPLDYVVQMSLTFEQANLDFAEEYATRFERDIGDEKTSKLLHEVHEDEIKHVAHGWKWFNEWRDQKEKDSFEAYRKSLPFPMTARRARGTQYFASSARKEAGLTPDFIESVRITGGSRGRIPEYFFFNPECEIEDQFDTLPEVLKQKIEDLKPLLLWCGKEEDLVELTVKPDLEFLTEVHRIRGKLPEMLTLKSPLSSEQVLQEFKPWGWGTGAWKKRKQISNTIKKDTLFSETLHSEKLFSKSYIKNTFHTMGASIDSQSDWEEFLKRHAAESETYILKAEKSTSGRGHLTLKAPLPKTPPKKPPFVIEPFRNKIFDFSVQYEIDLDGTMVGRKVKTFPARTFKIDSHFQYRGAFLGEPTEPIRESEYKEAHQKVIDHLKSLQYHGPVGIDALVYQDSVTKENVVEPIIEVNARMTMGRVALFIEEAMRKSLGKSKGIWVFINHSDLKGLGFKTFLEYEESLRKKYGKLFFPTTPAKTSVSTWTFAVIDEKFYSDFKAT